MKVKATAIFDLDVTSEDDIIDALFQAGADEDSITIEAVPE